MNYQPMSLQKSHGFSAQGIEGNPHTAVLTAPPDTSREAYHSVLKQLGVAGVKRVVVDVSDVSTPSGKLSYAYMKPATEDVPGVESIYIAGITRNEIRRGAHSEHAARSMVESDGFKTTIDEAVAECLR